MRLFWWVFLTGTVAGIYVSSPMANAAEPVLKCGSCHVQEAHAQSATPMGHALSISTYAASPKPFETERDGYKYRVDVREGASTYSVTNGNETISVPIHWTFGAKSQTYVLEYQGAFYESLVSFFREIDGLDVTLGDSVIHPATIVQALGRPIDAKEQQSCFGCHSSGASVTNGQLKLDQITPGVTCIRCHADGLAHQAEALRGKPVHLPSKLADQSSDEISQVCGQCHRTWETVMRMRIKGPNDVRFQPYRLANSKCYDGSDQRLSCITCHNPHRSELPTTAQVDSKCLACHASADSKSAIPIAGESKPRSCPVAKENCASCHMPKVQLPGGHRPFTDHQIRIARTSESYPN